MKIHELLTFCVKQGASDLHLSAVMPPMIRVDGDIRRINLPPLSIEDVTVMLSDIMDEQQQQELHDNLELDFAYEVPDIARFRVNVFHQNRGLAAAFRTIPSRVLTIEELGLKQVFKDLAMVPRGLVLVTGPTGSGKSTTLAAMIDYINDNKHDHVLTIEDPVEFIHHSKKSLINQREVHQHTRGFNAALRSALREDPDVILLGELRDLETMFSPDGR